MATDEEVAVLHDEVMGLHDDLRSAKQADSRSTRGAGNDVRVEKLNAEKARLQEQLSSVTSRYTTASKDGEPKAEKEEKSSKKTKGSGSGGSKTTVTPAENGNFTPVVPEN